jgi:hypothetical protein
MSTLHFISYGCKCGKSFQGEENKINFIIKLHHKKCKFKMIKDSTPVIMDHCVSHPKSNIKINGTAYNTEMNIIGSM